MSRRIQNVILRPNQGINVGYKQDTGYLRYEMQSDDLQISFSRSIRNCDPPFELELYRASPELALKGGVTGHSSKKTPHQTQCFSRVSFTVYSKQIIFQRYDHVRVRV
jgi:hypothetical protein